MEPSREGKFLKARREKAGHRSRPGTKGLNHRWRRFLSPFRPAFRASLRTRHKDSFCFSDSPPNHPPAHSALNQQRGLREGLSDLGQRLFALARRLIEPKLFRLAQTLAVRRPGVGLQPANRLKSPQHGAGCQ